LRATPVVAPADILDDSASDLTGDFSPSGTGTDQPTPYESFAPEQIIPKLPEIEEHISPPTILTKRSCDTTPLHFPNLTSERVLLLYNRYERNGHVRPIFR